MIRKIRKTLAGIKFLLFAKKELFVTDILNKKQVRTVKGTINKVKEQDELWYNLLAQHSEKIYEVGCNIGQTALLALTNDNVKKVLLLDPNPEALSLANKNIIQNNFIHKTQSFLGFVSNEINNELDFYTIGYGASGSMYSSHAETAAAIGSFYKVQTTTLDYLSNYFQWSPDFMKIDVEGAEALVLEGAKNLAKATDIKILVEMHTNHELTMEDNASKILEWCKEVGYEAWYLKTNEKMVSPEIIKHRGRCHLLLISAKFDYPEYLK